MNQKQHHEVPARPSTWSNKRAQPTTQPQLKGCLGNAPKLKGWLMRRTPSKRTNGTNTGTSHSVTHFWNKEPNDIPAGPKESQKSHRRNTTTYARMRCGTANAHCTKHHQILPPLKQTPGPIANWFIVCVYRDGKKDNYRTRVTMRGSQLSRWLWNTNCRHPYSKTPPQQHDLHSRQLILILCRRPPVFS